MIEVGATQPPPTDSGFTPSGFGAGAHSAGAILRHAREAAGLHYAVLASALKVPQRQIEALEQDRLDVLPDIVHARALAASICRQLGVDPSAVLDRMPRGPEPRLGQHERINVPFRGPTNARTVSARTLLRRPAVVTAGVLVLGALVLVALPFVPGLPGHGGSTAVAPERADGAEGGARPAAGAAMGTETVAPAEGGRVDVAPVAPNATAAPAPAAAAVAPGSAPAGVAAAASAVPAPAPAAAAASAVPAAAEGGWVEFHAAQPSWVQVTDARGAVPLRRTLAAGESVTVGGTPPLAVTVGSIHGMQVQVRGAPFDIAPMAQGNVARFEIR